MKVESKIIFSIIFIFSSLNYFSQSDSITPVITNPVQLKEVNVITYMETRPMLRLPSSAAIIDSAQLQKQNGQSLVPALNAIAGVRMEERSPASYRLSIRGSLLRSPYGVRNTKIYIDEFPLTNAGGDAYLNLIDFNSIHHIEILKGPDGSLFGANSGGVLRILPTSLKNESSQIRLAFGGGSYGLFQQNIGIEQKLGDNQLSIQESWQRADGYRGNSSMDRRSIQLNNRWNYSDRGQMRFFFLYSDLNYQTPGGLTLTQYNEDPKQARPATKVSPGAAEQKARIANQTFYAGILNEYKITESIRHVISVFGSQTQFENPFITNYEIRDENNGGARTWFEFKNKNASDIKLTFNVGAEGQAMLSRIANYGNRQGARDTVQAYDEVTVMQGFLFSRVAVDFYNKWLLEASISYNYNQLIFSRQQPILTNNTKRLFEPQLMPRVAASYLLTDYFSLRASVSRGYSPPTLQEIRSSNTIFNTDLQPESGWNYETGFRLKTKNETFWWDATIFYYQLDNAIVKRLNDDGQEYFINAGGTYQPGFETQITWQLIKERDENFIRGLQLSEAYTYHDFAFNDYQNESANFSGNKLSGVPQHIYVTGLTISLPMNFYLFTQYNYTAKIPLNDANSEYADEYHLVQLKAGWKFKRTDRFTMELCGGVDNLLDQRYSLGNDLNAFGGRYYNAAPGRNYFAKLDLWF